MEAIGESIRDILYPWSPLLDPRYSPRGTDPLRRFMRRVVLPESPDGCWGWTGTIKATGKSGQQWGAFALHTGRSIAVGRASWILHNGDIPNGLMVCHRCDNGMCGNPAHLYLGTHQDNMADKVANGRHLRANARHLTATGSGTLAHVRIRGRLYRKHFPKGTDPAVFENWLAATRLAAT